MAYRVLIDENIDPSTAERLGDRGHEAVTVADALEKGVDDPSIRTYGATHEYLLLTNDADFLRPDRRGSIRVLYVPEQLGDLANRLVKLVNDVVQEAAADFYRRWSLPSSRRLSQNPLIFL